MEDIAQFVIKECNQTFESFALLSDYQIEKVLLKNSSGKEAEDAQYDLTPQQAYAEIWHKLRGYSMDWVKERWNRLHPDEPWDDNEPAVPTEEPLP